MDANDLRRELRSWADLASARGAELDDIIDALVEAGCEHSVTARGWQFTADCLHRFAEKMERRAERKTTVTMN